MGVYNGKHKSKHGATCRFANMIHLHSHTTKGYGSSTVYLGGVLMAFCSLFGSSPHLVVIDPTHRCEFHFAGFVCEIYALRDSFLRESWSLAWPTGLIGTSIKPVCSIVVAAAAVVGRKPRSAIVYWRVLR